MSPRPRIIALSNTLLAHTMGCGAQRAVPSTEMYWASGERDRAFSMLEPGPWPLSPHRVTSQIPGQVQVERVERRFNPNITKNQVPSVAQLGTLWLEPGPWLAGCLWPWHVTFCSVSLRVFFRLRRPPKFAGVSHVTQLMFAHPFSAIPPSSSIYRSAQMRNAFAV